MRKTKGAGGAGRAMTDDIQPGQVRFVVDTTMIQCAALATNYLIVAFRLPLIQRRRPQKVGRVPVTLRLLIFEIRHCQTFVCLSIGISRMTCPYFHV